MAFPVQKVVGVRGSRITAVVQLVGRWSYWLMCSCLLLPVYLMSCSCDRRASHMQKNQDKYLALSVSAQLEVCVAVVAGV